jgi:hypothetical protein
VLCAERSARTRASSWSLSEQDGFDFSRGADLSVLAVPVGKEGVGVLVGALQSEREEETRDRAERGSVVRGSDQASVAPERIPAPD